MQDPYTRSKQKRFKRKKTLSIPKKLALICLYSENKLNYKYSNIGKFWNNISSLLKQNHNIDFNSLR